MATFRFNGHEITPESQQLDGSHYKGDASESDYILIQFSDHLQEKQVAELGRLGVRALKFLGQDTYSCRYEPSDLEAIRRLPYVVYANVYHAGLGVSPSLRQKMEHHSQPLVSTSHHGAQHAQLAMHTESRRRFHIVLHDDHRATEARDAIAHLTSMNPENILDEGFGILRAPLTPSELDQVSQIDDVASVQEIGGLELLNNEAIKILKVEDEDEDAFGEFQSASSSASLPDLLKGSDQIVVVADSGFDNGKTTDVHEAFSGRVVEVKAFRSDATITAAQDDHGHGTHVAGSVLGSANSTQFGDVAGSAPEALLIAQAITATRQVDSQGLDARLADIFTHYMKGDTMPRDASVATSALIPRPRVHNNSWGTPWDDSVGQTGYSSYAKIVDGLVRDNQDWVLVFSAGNSGSKTFKDGQLGQIMGAAGAKNVITVGACETNRPINRALAKYDATSLVPGRPNRVADFSSRGPTLEDRLKPDVVAPGFAIYSARSRQLPLGIAEVTDDQGNAVKDDQGNIKYDYDKRGTSTDTKWIFSSGTSMAAPLVSGICAILRNAYSKKHSLFPSASMVKALLVNGADDMSIHNDYLDSSDNGGKAPNGWQGWGRVNVQNSLRPLNDPQGGTYDSLEFTLDNKPRTYTEPRTLGRAGIAPPKFDKIMISVENSTLVATLVYPDVPAEPGAEELINKVSFTVTTPDNLFPLAPDPSPLVDATTDKRNNVRRYTKTIKKKGLCTVVVKCTSTLQSGIDAYKTQDFAFCWDVRPPPPPAPEFNPRGE
jgi:hypothetical protein